MENEVIKIAGEIFNSGSKVTFSPGLLSRTVAQIQEKLIEGYGRDFPQIIYNTPDYEELRNLTENVYSFSAAKNYQQLKDMTLALTDGERIVTEGEFVITPEFYLTFPDRDKWILVNTSSDTIFHYLPDGNLSPFIVRSPSISSMDTKVFLFPTVITDRYCFMRTMRKEVDFTTFKGFLGEDLVYDKQENALFSYILYNDDFINKEEVSLTSEPRNPEIAICQTLDAPDLVEAYEKGQLKGKLKEIAANLSEESNPVVMLLKKKK